MKAVITNTIIGALCLVTIVLAAPHQSKAPKNHCESFTCEPDRMMEITCQVKKPVSSTQSAPVAHESNSFLYW